MHFQELNNRTLLAARGGHEMSLKMLKFIFSRGASPPPWTPQRGVTPAPHQGLGSPWTRLGFSGFFFFGFFSKAVPMPVYTKLKTGKTGRCKAVLCSFYVLFLLKSFSFRGLRPLTPTFQLTFPFLIPMPELHTCIKIVKVHMISLLLKALT